MCLWGIHISNVSTQTPTSLIIWLIPSKKEQCWKLQLGVWLRWSQQRWKLLFTLHGVTRKAKAQTTRIQVQKYKIMLIVSLKTTPVTQSILCLISLMCAASQLVSWYFKPRQPQRIISGLKTNFNLSHSNHAPLNYSGQKSTDNLPFIIPTYLWPWMTVKIITPGMTC